MYCEAERRGSPEAFTVSAGQVVPFDEARPTSVEESGDPRPNLAASREFTEQADF